MINLRSALEQTDRDLRGAFSELLRGDSLIQEAMRYAVLDGGKRLRPFLVLEFGKIFGVPFASALRVAMSIELIHCYSLVHDDLPSMDDGDMRRGKASMHKRFDEATAILAGDALQSLAFELLSDCHEDSSLCMELVLLLARASGAEGMVAGQMLDMQSDGGTSGEAMLIRLQELKTGCLFEFSCNSMAVLGRVDVKTQDSVCGYARNLGLAFQMTDDLLDAEDSSITGKDSDKDRSQNKATWVSLLGAEKTLERATLLCGKAKDHLEIFSNEADLLRSLVHSIANRKR